MDSKRTAYEKMLCITECSKNIYKAINISASVTRSINEATLLSEASTPTPTAAASAAPAVDDTNSAAFDELDALANPDGGGGAHKKKKKKKESASRSVATADDYLPAFIYIVLKTNPTMLYSNINFISRFAFEKRVLQGADAYHFCSLVSINQSIKRV